MRAYTISKLADDAGVSPHVVRDYELRGLLCPCRCSPNGYRIYDDQVLRRLQFVLAGKAAGISLTELAELCQAMDNSDAKAVEQSLSNITKTLEQHEQAIGDFRHSLSGCVNSPSRSSATKTR